MNTSGINAASINGVSAGLISIALGSCALGSAVAVARSTPSAVALGSGLLGSGIAQGRFTHPEAPPIPSGVTLYRCKLTGSQDGRTDAVLPIRSFQVRHRRATASYYQVVIPSLDYIDAIEDRPNGQIVIWSDTDGIEEELMRGSLGNVRGDRGPNNQAITISGNASRAATPRATYRVTRVLYQYSTFDGEQRLRIEPRAAIRPGDTIQFEGSFFEAGVVTWSVSVSETGLSAQMEVATLAEEYPTPDPDPQFSFIETGSAALDEYVQYSALVPAGEWVIRLTNLTADLDLYADFAAFMEDNAQFGSWQTNLADESIALTLVEETTVYIAVHGYRAGSYTLTIGPA